MHITEHTFQSSCMAGPVQFTLMCPTRQQSTYPVLWIGGPGKHNEWFEHTNIAQYADQYGLAIVEADSSQSWGGRDVKEGHYHFESYFTQELPQQVAKLLPISTDPKQNIITGWSRAGYLALRLGLTYPQHYGTILCHSGGNVDAYGLYKDIGGAFPGLLPRMFDGISTAQEFEASLFHPECMVEKMHNEGAAFPQLVFLCGSDDPLARIPNVRLSEKMKAWGIPHRLTLLPGAHTWEFIDTAVQVGLQQIFTDNKTEKMEA